MPDSANIKQVQVLCYYKAWGREAGRPRSWFDSIMITVARSSEVPEAFAWEMSRWQRFHDYRKVYPMPLRAVLLKYLPENGARWFDATLSIKKNEGAACPSRSSESLP